MTESSGNVFADIGVPNPELALAKADLAHRIGEEIRGRKLSQAAAASTLEITQPKVSNLLRGKLDGFSMDRLLKFLNRLNLDVEIVVGPVRGTKRQAGTRVVRA